MGINMKVENTLKVYEFDGRDVSDQSLIVQSYWRWGDYVNLIIGVNSYTISIRDLLKALHNVSNHR